MAINLRDYQNDAIASFEAAIENGTRRPVIVLPTGAGKTLVFAEILNRIGGRALILAHRDELVSQAAEKIIMVMGSTADIGIVKAQRNECNNKIVVASVQTIQRLSRCSQLGKFDLIIIDECHHAPAVSYRNIVKWLNGFESDGPIVLGVTATPDRFDNIGLDTVFQKIVFSMDTLDLIERGHLVSPRAIQVSLSLGLDDVKKFAGDFSINDLDRKMRFANAPVHVVKAWHEHAEGKKTVVFTTSVEMAHSTAEKFIADNITCETIDYLTPSVNRRAILDRFHSGKTLVLCNMGVLTEGWDETTVECICICRPTTSRSLYTQILGRGLRNHPGKEECIVLDLVDVSTRHKLITTATLFGLPIKDVAGKGGVLAAKRVALIKAAAQASADDAARIAREISLFNRERISWSQKDGVYRLTLADGHARIVPQGSNYGVIRHNDATNSDQIVASNVNLGYAQGIAEDMVRSMGGKVKTTITTAPWTASTATAAQISMLKKFNIDFDADTITAGDANNLIRNHFKK